MSLKVFAVLITVIALSVAGTVSAQEKEDKTDKTTDAKKLSTQFAKAMFADKDSPGVMKLVAVPFSWPYDDAKTVNNADELKKKIDALFAKQREAVKGVIKIEGAKSIDADDKEKGLKKGDVIVGVSITPKEAEGLNLFVKVASPGGQLKVVGFMIVPPIAFGELKKKN